MIRLTNGGKGDSCGHNFTNSDLKKFPTIIIKENIRKKLVIENSEDFSINCNILVIYLLIKQYQLNIQLNKLNSIFIIQFNFLFM